MHYFVIFVVSGCSGAHYIITVQAGEMCLEYDRH